MQSFLYFLNYYYSHFTDEEMEAPEISQFMPNHTGTMWWRQCLKPGMSGFTLVSGGEDGVIVQ